MVLIRDKKKIITKYSLSSRTLVHHKIDTRLCELMNIFKPSSNIYDIPNVMFTLSF